MRVREEEHARVPRVLGVGHVLLRRRQVGLLLELVDLVHARAHLLQQPLDVAVARLGAGGSDAKGADVARGGDPAQGDGGRELVHLGDVVVRREHEDQTGGIHLPHERRRDGHRRRCVAPLGLEHDVL